MTLVASETKKRKGIAMSHSCNFSLSHYREILTQASTLGYKFPCQREVLSMEKEKRFLFIRHDIEISLTQALEMAELEHKMGIITTYLFLLSSPFYNPFDQESFDIITAIKEMGHEIGIHYDVSFYTSRGLDALDGVRRDVACLESVFGVKIRSISQHRPASSPRYSALDKEYIEAYRTELVQDIKYVSDSSQSWRDRCLCYWLDRSEQIHVLIHPFVWSADNLQYADILWKIVAERNRHLTQEVDSLIERRSWYLSAREELDRQRQQYYEHAED